MFSFRDYRKRKIKYCKSYCNSTFTLSTINVNMYSEISSTLPYLFNIVLSLPSTNKCHFLYGSPPPPSHTHPFPPYLDLVLNTGVYSCIWDINLCRHTHSLSASDLTNPLTLTHRPTSEGGCVGQRQAASAGWRSPPYYSQGTDYSVFPFHWWTTLLSFFFFFGGEGSLDPFHKNLYNFLSYKNL